MNNSDYDYLDHLREALKGRDERIAEQAVRIAELEAALRWALEWIADGLAIPPHDCGFLGDTGHCAFHERYFGACAVLEEYPNEALAGGGGEPGVGDVAIKR